MLLGCTPLFDTQNQELVPSISPSSTIEDVDSYLKKVFVTVSDGSRLGCDIICWIDGFGFCYNIGSKYEIENYSISFEKKEDIENYSVYYILLQEKDAQPNTRCLGEIKCNRSFSKNIYGVPYILDIWLSESAELKPIWLDWNCFKRDGDTEAEVGFIRSYNIEKSEITVSLGEQGKIAVDFPVGVLEESVQEERLLFKTIPDTIFTIWGEGAEMLVTEERFFQLLKNGYLEPFDEKNGWFDIGFYIGRSGDNLLYLREMYTS